MGQALPLSLQDTATIRLGERAVQPMGKAYMADDSIFIGASRKPDDSYQQVRQATGLAGDGGMP